MATIKHRKLNKKGSMSDWFYVPVVFLICIVFLVASSMVTKKVIDMNPFSSDTTGQATNALNQSRATLLNMDNMMLFLIVCLSLFTIITGYFVGSHPVFFFVSVFLLTIAVLVSASISNTYETFESVTSINTYSSEFPKINFLMDKFPMYVAFMGFASAVSMAIGVRQNG